MPNNVPDDQPLNLKKTAYLPNIVALVLLSASVWLVYGQTLSHGFIALDDTAYILENKHVLTGLNWANIKWALFNVEASQWLPLTWLSLMLDTSLFGASAQGYHFTNVCLHTINSMLCFLVLKRATKNFWCSSIAAALFALHPLRVESVAWVTERKDVLTVCFFLLTIWNYLSYRDKPTIIRYIAIVIAMLLALMAKPVAVTLPFVLLLLDYWPLNRWALVDLKTTSRQIWPLVKEKLPLFLGILGLSYLQIAVVPPPTAQVELYPLSIRLQTVVTSYLFYLKDTFWPLNLAILYPYEAKLPLATVLFSITILLIISVISLYYARKYPFLIVGWCWFLGTLVPNIGIIQIGPQARADRFTYIAHIGLMIMLVWLIAAITTKLPYRQAFLTIITTVSLLLLTTLAWLQTELWRDNILLFKHTLAVTKDNYVIHNNLGPLLYDNGQVKEAYQEFQECLRINPNYREGRYNLAYSFYRQGLWSEAEPHFQILAQTANVQPEVYLYLGDIYNKQGQLVRAVEYYNKALNLYPTYPEVYNSIGLIMLQQKEYALAEAQFNLALKYRPNYPEAQANLNRLKASYLNNR